MNIPKLAIQNYHIVCTAFFMLLLASVLNFINTPRTEFPIIDIPAVSVRAVVAADIENMETHFLSPMEEVLHGLDDVKDIRSIISGNLISIMIDFTPGIDVNKKMDKVKNALAFIRKNLPNGLGEIVVTKSSTNFASVLNLALVPNNVSGEQLEKEAKRVQRIIRQVDGVKAVAMGAYPEQEIQIKLDLEKMYDQGITFREIESVLVKSNTYIPSGDVDVSSRKFNVLTTGAFSDLDELKNTLIKNANGDFLKLEDIASIASSFEKERWLSRYIGKEALLLHVNQNTDADVIRLTEKIKSRLNDFKFEEDIQLEYVYCQANEVDKQVNTFFMNLAQGLGLVCLVLFLVLGARSALIIGLFIPLASFIGLMLTNLWGLGLNQMTIVGMIVSLGLLVDNSIAIVENIERLLEEGYEKFDACVEGVNQLLFPMTSSTLTTMAVFIPIIFMPDVTGDFIKPMPVIVLFTMLASLLIAIILSPVLCFFFLQKDKKKPLGSFVKRMEERFEKLLSYALNNRVETLVVLALVFVTSLSLFPYVGVTFFPKADKNFFYITIQTEEGKNLEYTDKVVLEVEKLLHEKEEIKAFTTSVGHGNPTIYYNIGTANYSSTYGEIFIETELDNKKKFNAFIADLRAELSPISKAKINVKEYSQGLPEKYPLEVVVTGENLEQLKAYNKTITEKVKKIDGIINVNNSMESQKLNIAFDINYKEAAMLGVSESQIENEIKNIFKGSVIGDFTSTDNNKLNIKLNYELEEFKKVEALKNIRIRSSKGTLVAMNKVVDVQLSNSINQLEHFNFDRISTVSADIVDDKELNRILGDLREELIAINWEPGYSFSFKGDFENKERSFGQLGYAILIAILIIVTILIAQYKSFLIPLIILSILPLTITGAIFALFITGQSFSFTAFIGLISLVGICINDSIILVDFSYELLKKGHPPKEAAILGAKTRLVPVLMTSITTIFGLLFLALNGGSLWTPMATTIIGGLIGTTFFVLILAPVLFVYVGQYLMKNKSELTPVLTK